LVSLDFRPRVDSVDAAAMPQLIWSHFAEPIESRPALAITPPASGELTLETTPVVRSDCDLTQRAAATRSGWRRQSFASFGAVSD
jgi:hypothetical protein